MQGLIVSALVLCSIFAIAYAGNGDRKCYHCLSGEINIGSKSICNDKDNMKSAKCAKWNSAIEGPRYVETKYGLLPELTARGLGYKGEGKVVVPQTEFQCAKLVVAGKSEDATVNYDISVYSCLGKDPNAVIGWTGCTEDNGCHLCDEDECNSASGVAASVLLSVVAFVFARLH